MIHHSYLVPNFIMGPNYGGQIQKIKTNGNTPKQSSTKNHFQKIF